MQKGTKSYRRKGGEWMKEELYEKICKINCLLEDADSLYHQAALKLGVSDSAMLVLYMLYTNGGECRLYDIYKLSGICKQTINSAVRKLEKEELIWLEKQDRKSKKVCFTEKGKAYAEQTAARLFQAEYNAFREWKEEEIDLYLKLIEKYNISLRREIKKL